jgi:hypothetical protein
MAMTKQRINRAIKHLNLEIQGNRRDGYFYFTDLTTGAQVGESIMVCYLNQQPLERWVQDATSANATREPSKDDGKCWEDVMGFPLPTYPDDQSFPL